MMGAARSMDVKRQRVVSLKSQPLRWKREGGKKVARNKENNV